MNVSGDFRRLALQTFPGSMSQSPLVGLKLGTVVILTLFQHANCVVVSFSVLSLRKVPNLTSRNPAKVPLNLCAPTFIMLPTSLVKASRMALAYFC